MDNKLERIVSRMANLAIDQQVWECPFNRNDLLRIWAQSEETLLTTDDEKRAFQLLTTYNGACPVQLLSWIVRTSRAATSFYCPYSMVT